MVPRQPAEASIPFLQPIWLTADGKLDPQRLLEAFLAFWRQHGQPLLKSAPYHEVAPHLVMMAFLHRVANAGGTLEREYAIGSGRMDLLLRYKEARLAIELKTWRSGEHDPLEQGLAQLDGYMAGLGLETGWLVIFDQRPGLPPISERTSAEEAVTPAGRQVTVIRVAASVAAELEDRAAGADVLEDVQDIAGRGILAQHQLAGAAALGGALRPLHLPRRLRQGAQGARPLVAVVGEGEEEDGARDGGH